MHGNRKKPVSLLAAVALLGLVSTSSEALVISYDTDATGTTIGLTTANWQANSTSTITPLALPNFDPTLGTLNQVSITYGGTGNFVYKIENLSGSTTSTGTNELFVNLAFDPLVNAAGETVIVSTGALAIDLDTYDGNLDFGGSSGVDFGIMSDDQEITEIITSNLSDFIGTGLFFIDVQATSGSDRNISGGQLVEWTTWQAGAWARVEYDYTPLVRQIPEPMGITALGLAVLGAFRSRKRLQKRA